mmetsp:Transcript_59776/g.71211  ORF Transcript_59776/g.71211 Transcript_59776/m.71211 type:complete len:102 (-) Transcript_59776:33-338(-)
MVIEDTIGDRYAELLKFGKTFEDEIEEELNGKRTSKRKSKGCIKRNGFFAASSFVARTGYKYYELCYGTGDSEKFGMILLKLSDALTHAPMSGSSKFGKFF